MDSINKTAARFKEVRKELKLTQEQIAQRLHLKRNTIAKIERGLTTPSARSLSSLEALLTESPRKGAADSLAEDHASYDANAPSSQVPRIGIHRDDIERHFARLLDLAEKSPAGLAYVRAMLRNIDEGTLVDMAADAIVARDRAADEAVRQSESQQRA